jgi:hypothetical protein
MKFYQPCHSNPSHPISMPNLEIISFLLEIHDMDSEVYSQWYIFYDILWLHLPPIVLEAHTLTVGTQLTEFSTILKNMTILKDPNLLFLTLILQTFCSLKSFAFHFKWFSTFHLNFTSQKTGKKPEQPEISAKISHSLEPVLLDDLFLQVT